MRYVVTEEQFRERNRRRIRLKKNAPPIFVRSVMMVCGSVGERNKRCRGSIKGRYLRINYTRNGGLALTTLGFLRVWGAEDRSRQYIKQWSESLGVCYSSHGRGLE